MTSTRRPVLSRLGARLRGPLTAFAAIARNRDVRRLQLAWAASAMGQWAASIAVTVISFEAGGATAVAVQVVARMIPAAVAAPLLATLADRRSRVLLMVTADVGRVALVAGMAMLVLADAPLGLLYVGSALSGVLGSAFEPAKSALLPELAREPDELTAANVVSSSIDSVSVFAGPALGGLLLALTSTPVVLGATACTFAVSALLIAGIRERERPRAGAAVAPHEPFARAVADGVRAVAGHRAARTIVGLIALQTFVDGLSIALVAATALDLLELGEAGVGLLTAASGVGGLAGVAVAAGLVGSRRLGLAFIVGCLLWGLPFALIGIVPAVAVALVALALVGLGNTLTDVSGFTLLQRAAPEDVLARVFGVMESLILASVALGAALAPVLVAGLGVTGALVATGAVLPVAVALRWDALRRLDADVAAGAEIALLQRVPLLAALPAPVLERLAHRCERVQVAAGEAAVRQGEPGDRFYVVVSGRMDVLVDGRRVRTHAAGDGFGEVALLRDVPRTATVRASEPAELLALTRDEFLAAVTGHPPSRAVAEETVTARLAWARPAPAV